MIRPPALASLLTLAACARNPAFQLASDESASTTLALTTTTTNLSSGPDSSSTSPTTAAPTTAAPTTGLTGDDTSTSTSTGDPTTGEPAAPISCGQARELGMLTSGLQKLAVPNQPGVTIEVWCEQEIADGGWMLVGRSAEDSDETGFGWTQDLGDPAIDDQPYSLDAVSLGLPMSQILIGAHEGGNRPIDDVYALTVATDFLTAYADQPAEVINFFKVLGDCDPPGGPTMLRWLGYTDLTDRFRMRDLQNEDNGSFGLRVDGFELNYPFCLQGADLDDRQGIIFVR